MSCRSLAREEVGRNGARMARLRSLGFDARLDEVQAVVRRNRELAEALAAATVPDRAGAR